jgi:L-asparagine transporter-like permease
MKFLTWLIAILLVVAVFGTHRTVRRSRSAEERFFAMRLAAFTWIFGFAVVVALLFLPNKQRVLALLPIFLVAITIAKLWRDGRARLRREQDERTRFDQMKRIN